MTLRAAVPADVNAMADIMGQWFADTPFVPRLHSKEEDRWFVSRLIESDDVMVAATDTVTGFIARNETEIGQLYVAEAVRGAGIGGQLLDLMKGRAPRLALWCFQPNTGARRFYERHGFVATTMTDGLSNEERVPDVRYVWSAAS